MEEDRVLPDGEVKKIWLRKMHQGGYDWWYVKVPSLNKYYYCESVTVLGETNFPKPDRSPQATLRGYSTTTGCVIMVSVVGEGEIEKGG